MDDFGELMRVELERHGYTLRAACKAMYRNPSFPSRVMNGKQPPSAALARDLDGLLGTSKFTVALRAAADRIDVGAAAPSRVDAGVVDALAAVLSSYRHLDDAMGSAAMIPTTKAQLRQVADMARDARGPYRDRLIEVAAGWAVFGGWIATAVGDYAAAEVSLNRAAEWSAEADSPTLASITWSFKGYLLAEQDRPAETIGLASAASRVRRAHPAQQAYAVLQTARGHAMLGERDEARRALDAGNTLVDRAAAAGEPPEAIYWNRPPFFRLHMGRTLLLLEDFADAADQLDEGIRGLPPGQRGAEWTAKYTDALASARSAR